MSEVLPPDGTPPVVVLNGTFGKVRSIISWIIVVVGVIVGVTLWLGGLFSHTLSEDVHEPSTMRAIRRADMVRPIWVEVSKQERRIDNLETQAAVLDARTLAIKESTARIESRQREILKELKER